MVQTSIIILSYLVVINLIAFVLYGIDKKRAIRNEHRIRESVLLWIARLGGAIGSWLGIKSFHHKTKHTKFRVIVPLWMIIWIAAIVVCIIIQPSSFDFHSDKSLHHIFNKTNRPLLDQFLAFPYRLIHQGMVKFDYISIVSLPDTFK